MSWEDDVFSVPDIAWQATRPPARHAVPARFAGDLAVGDELAIALPGRYVIDHQVLARSERSSITLPGTTETRDALGVAAPFAFYLAKAFPSAGLTMQWWPVDYTWVYRDALNPGQTAQAPTQDTPEPADSWLSHVRSSLAEPPTLHPRRARDAGPLVGRTVRLQHEPGAWSWWVAVSEPVDADGEISVQVMTPEHYWLTQVVYESDTYSRPVALHRLWVYA